MSSASIQAAISRGYGIAGSKLGRPYALFRTTGSNPLSGSALASLPAVFTNAKATGFNFERSSTFDDVLFAVLADATQLQIGDYLTGPGGTFFIADMPALRPVVAVGCNTAVTVTRPNTERATSGGQGQGYQSQPGSTGRYRGVGATVAPSGPGETVIRSGIPASMIGTTGRATGTGELPSDAPGPSRWRVYLPQSAFPKGSVEDRDVVTDDQGNRHQVSAAYWSTIGYRIEAVRLES